jgi:hypothetical protein
MCRKLFSPFLKVFKLGFKRERKMRSEAFPISKKGGKACTLHHKEEKCRSICTIQNPLKHYK